MSRLILATGGTRGIGKAVLAHWRMSFPHDTIVSLQRGDSVPLDGVQVFPWDLAAPFDAEAFARLKNLFFQMPIAGLLHCAGILGPLGFPTLGNERLHEELTLSAYQVNHVGAQTLIEALLPTFASSVENLNSVPFVFHLTSGAASHPYVGWEAYCGSKAAARMYFRSLAQRFSAKQLLSLSVAPGRVKTEMMTEVLAANVQDFPQIHDFRKDYEEGKMAEPQVVAQKIVELFREDKTPFGNALGELHGKFFHVDRGIVN
jgi:benzil reductase ((S)-benzoin forming)